MDEQREEFAAVLFFEINEREMHAAVTFVVRKINRAPAGQAINKDARER